MVLSKHAVKTTGHNTTQQNETGIIAYRFCNICGYRHLVRNRAEELSSHNLGYNSIEIFIGGLASIAIFSTCGFFTAKKIFDNKPGIIINDQGISDSSGATATGMILWRDINSIRQLKIARQSMLIIEVNNPQAYIGNKNSFLKRKVMALNLKSYGSPIFISANGPKSNFNSLYTTIVNSCNLYRSTTE